MTDNMAGGLSEAKVGPDYTVMHSPRSERKPSNYETPVSPTSSSVSDSSQSGGMRERRYVSAPKLPQSEYEALDEERIRGVPSPLMREIISEQYIDMRSGGSALLHPVTEQAGHDYTYIDESQLSTDAPSNYEYIDEGDRTSLLTKTNVSDWYKYVVVCVLLCRFVVHQSITCNRQHSRQLVDVTVNCLTLL